MFWLSFVFAFCFFSPSHTLTLSPSTPTLTQTPPAAPRPGVGPADRPAVNAEAADRGRKVWAVECVTCHGAGARGTDQGANLIRSEVILKDRFGSELKPFLRKGHPLQSGAPATSLTDAQITDITHFVRQRIEDTLRGSVMFVPGDILTGNAAAGKQYFDGEGQCTTCHSATGDLAGVAARIPNPVDLQTRMLFPTGRGRGAAPNRAAVTVTITPTTGAPISGVLVNLDDFYVSFRDTSGNLRVMKRTRGMKVVRTDPLDAHHQLLRKITDTQMHDMVAYLASLK